MSHASSSSSSSCLAKTLSLRVFKKGAIFERRTISTRRPSWESLPLSKSLSLSRIGGSFALQTISTRRPSWESLPFGRSLSLSRIGGSFDLQSISTRRSTRESRHLRKSLSLSRIGGIFDLRTISTRRLQMENGRLECSRGSLIVLEGLDRSGKTSQSRRLVSFLEEEGVPVEAWHFPDRRTSIGSMISSYLANNAHLDDRAVHLLFSANRWEKRSLMEAKLNSGISLIVDRYAYSGVAFSAAKGLPMDWCKAPEEGLIAPDVVVYLDIPPERAAERGGYGEERYERLEFQSKVSDCYRNLRDASWKIIDGCLAEEDIQSKLRGLVLECISQCKRGKPLSTLWVPK
ncbi:P-loop containing nucleoside triphosphate hydrolases superfamily protein isoform X1 [Wolffia australiana]